MLGFDKKRHVKTGTAVLLLIVAVFSASGFLDTQAERLTEKSFTRSLVAFAAARGLNGVISVAQGTEFALQPAGVGVNFAPGQILDPVNDLIERFSWVMLAASTSLGIQKLLIVMISSRSFSLLVSVLCVFGAVLLWPRKREVATATQSKLLKVVLLFLVIRFGIIVLTLGNELLFETFLSERYDSAYSQLQNATTEIDTLNKQEQAATKAPTGEKSWIDTIKGHAAQLSSTFDISAKMDAYKALAGELSRSTVELVVIFLFQTILLPLAFLSLLLALVKMILQA